MRTISARLIGYPDQSAAEPRPASPSTAAACPSADDQVVLEKHLADALSLAPGATIEVALANGWQQVTVSGVGVSPEYLWPARSRQEILVPPDEWGVVFAPPALVSAAPPPTIHAPVAGRLRTGRRP